MFASEKDSLNEMTYSGVMLEISEHSIRVGVSGDAEPRVEYPMATGVLSSSVISPASKSLRFFPLNPKEIRYDINVLKGFLYNSEMQQYTIEDRSSLETAVTYAMSHSAPTHQTASVFAQLPILVLEGAQTNRSLRDTLASILFSSLQTDGLFFAKQAALATFGCGRTSGIVWDSGYSRTTSAVVIQGYTVPSSVLEIPLGGTLLNKKLQMLLSKSSQLRSFYIDAKSQTDSHKGESYISDSYKNWSIEELVEFIKRQVCVFTENSTGNSQTIKSSPYTLPDGTLINTHSFGSSLLEPFFTGILDSDTDLQYCISSWKGFPRNKWGCFSMIQESLIRAETQMPTKTKTLLDAIIVTGGNVLFPGFFSRFKNELDLTPCSKYKIFYPPQKHLRRHSAFIGGSILSCLGSFQNFVVTRKEYEEHGSVIFDKKCP